MAGFVQSWGLELRDKSGKAYDAKQLAATDVIAFYFSAHWCPPCRQFTPLLRKFVETLRDNGETSLKVIFVSSDKAEHEMWKYMYDAHGDWLALAFSCQDIKERLSRQYQVSGIPQLVVIDQVGRQAVRDARGEVMAAAQGSSTQVLTTYLAWRSAALASPSGGSAPSSAKAQARHDELPAGGRVRVQGLMGATEHNGAEGTILGYDSAKQRYVLQLGDKSLSLRAANLLQLMPVRLRSDIGQDASE